MGLGCGHSNGDAAACDDTTYGIGPGAYCNAYNQCDCLPGYSPVQRGTKCQAGKIYNYTPYISKAICTAEIYRPLLQSNLFNLTLLCRINKGRTRTRALPFGMYRVNKGCLHHLSASVG